MSRKALPVASGAGEIRFVGHSGPAGYEIEGDLAKLRPGPARLRGCVKLEPAVALAAFRAGEGVLTLAGGAVLRIVMVGHTAGGEDVYVEVRV